jgi:glutamine synthetase
MHGFLKGKRIQAEDMQKVCNNGFSMCAGVVLLDGLGYTIPGFPFSEADGDPDKQCRLVPGSIAPVPWSERPMAQAMFRYYEEDGSPFFADPRAVLERALEPLYKKRLKIVMATELEFYLLRRHRARRVSRASEFRSRVPTYTATTIFGKSKHSSTTSITGATHNASRRSPRFPNTRRASSRSTFGTWTIPSWPATTPYF